MPRKRLTLEALVERATFDPDNFRHRRALDESGPLDDPELFTAGKAGHNLPLGWAQSFYIVAKLSLRKAELEVATA